MPKIVVIGGTGYAGAAVVSEAANRGYEVTSVSRTLPADQIEKVTYVTGNATDPDFVASVVAGADVVVSTLSPRGELDGKIVDVDIEIAKQVRDSGARLFVVGGFSSLRPTESEPPAAESGQIPEQFRGEAVQMHAVLTHLQGQPDGLDWVFFSPAQEFGSYVPGEDLGRYRIGGDIVFVDENGRSAISGADFARAIVDRIEENDYHRAHISIAY
ncbi:NAD(P)-dependent oxidoreductase [Corynebacterium xerosis]|uniref:NAD(P)-dependent oxidoreductase n=1 Tax=Corynebacterium xerosis TaxID=1725 RepID=UPI00387A20B2